MTNKEKLINLEKEDKYVFHGSPVKALDILEVTFADLPNIDRIKIENN